MKENTKRKPPTSDSYGEAPARTGLVLRVVGEDGKPLDCSRPTPIEPEAIVFDPDQRFDALGRPLTLIEMEQRKEDE